jgi:uncharacterized protein YjeT (DUF2065 family)
MSVWRKVGLALVLAGLVCLVLGFVQFETRQEVFRFGNLQATTTTERTFPALRYAGIGVVAAGVLVWFLAPRQAR